SAARGAEVGRATGSDTVLVEDWSGQEIGHVGVPVGWEKQNWGQPKYDFRIEERHDGDRAQKVLHLRSEGDNSTITKRIGKIDVRKYPVLRWQWRAVTLPTGADARNAATDDQAAQVYLVFPRFPPAVRSRIIGYIWDTTAPAGSSFRSQTAGMVTYVVVR